MSERINNLKEAKRHFNKYNYQILCVKGKAEFMAKSYYEAEEFFQASIKGPENALMFQIEQIEKEIDKKMIDLNFIHYIPLNQMKQIFKKDPDFIKKTTEKINGEISVLNKKIKDMVKEHPEIEHYYILHKLTK